MIARQIAVAGLVVLVGASGADAQTTLKNVVSFLLTNQAVQTADFERDQRAAEAARDTITRALLVNLSGAPIATSSSGFLYRLNPELGTVERATQSFGAYFVERALTPGKGRASFGISTGTSAFDRLDDMPLRDGTLITTANTFRDEAAPFDTEQLTLRMRSSNVTFFGSVGVTDRLEIGGAVPFVRLSLDGERVNTYRGASLVQATASASTSGLADIAVRGKYALVSGRSGGVAAAAELRLPTGDEENLLGAGATAWRVLAIGSVDHGKLALHGNAGIARGGVSNEATFGAAASVAVRANLTVSGELLGRDVSELRSMALVGAPHPKIGGVDTLRLAPVDSGGVVSTAIASMKWNVTGALVLGAHLAWPLTNRGLTAPVTPTAALEYAF